MENKSSIFLLAIRVPVSCTNVIIWKKSDLSCYSLQAFIFNISTHQQCTTEKNGVPHVMNSTFASVCRSQKLFKGFVP